MTSGLKWKIAIGLLLVFLAGVAVGLFAGTRHGRHAIGDFHSGEMRQHFRERMVRQLELTPEQLKTLSPIIDDTARQVEEIRSESRRRVAETLARSHAAVSPHLTEQQRAELEKLRERHERRRGRRGDAREPRGHP